MRFLKMYKVEQKLFLRSPDVIIFNLLMPVVAMVIIAMVAKSYIAGSYVALSTVGICCSAFMSIPIMLVDYRSQGVLRRMYCSPCSPARLLACDTIASGVMAAISTIILTLVSTIVFGYRMEGNVLLYIEMWLLTTISMFSIGLMIASLCRTNKSMNVVTTVVYFPMLLFSGATIPAELFPKGLRVFSDILPLGVGINALKEVSMGQYDNLLIPSMILLVITLVCGTISLVTFRWE